MNRRHFLRISTCVALAPALSTIRAAESAEALDIIDCHTHFYDPERPEGVPWPGKGSRLYRTVLPSHLRAEPQFRKVTGTVIVEASPRVEDNQWLLDLAKEDPFVVGVVGNLPVGTPGFEEGLRRFAEDPLFRGIRTSSRVVREMLEADTLSDFKLLAAMDRQLDVNGGPETPALVARLAGALPGLRVVLNHIGNVAITADPPPVEWAEGIRQAAAHANVFCKVSALVEGAGRNGKKPPADTAFYKPYIDVVWDAFGDERVIYGSNWPVSEGAADYVTLQRIVMEYAASRGPEAVRKFCALNAKRAYKWVEREGRLPRR
jgi:L-fuconolactonase